MLTGTVATKLREMTEAYLMRKQDEGGVFHKGSLGRLECRKAIGRLKKQRIEEVSKEVDKDSI